MNDKYFQSPHAVRLRVFMATGLSPSGNSIILDDVVFLNMIIAKEYLYDELEGMSL